MSPVDDQVEAVTSTVAIADTIATTPINTESQTSSIVLPASTSTTTAMVANDSQISTNTPSIGIMAIPHEFSDLQCRQLEELASLHKLSDSDLEGYITSNETATGQLSVVQLLRLLSAGYDRARQSVDEKQHELVTLHAEFARQQERLWQLDRSVTLLQRQVITRRQQMNRSLSEQQELAVQSISTEQSQLQREIDSHPIPQIKVKPVRHKTSLKQVEETEDDIDPLNGHIESSLCSEDDELDRLPFDDVDMNEASHQHHKSRNIESRDRSSHLDRSQLDQDSFLNSYKRWRPRRGRRHSSLHRNALRRDSGPRSFAEEYDSDLDAEDTMWFSCGSPASSGDEQVPIGSMTKSSMETGSSIGGISLTGSLSSGALPRKSYFTSDNGTTRRPIALSSIGRPYSMTATSSGDHSQDRFNKGYMQKGKSPALLDEAAEADRQATVISPRARSSLEKWTAGLLTWRMSSAPSIARESDLNSQQQQETAAINNQHASKHLPTTSASTEHSLPISVNAETLKSRFLQEPLLSTLKEEHALKNSIAVAPTAVKTAIAAPSRSRSPVSGHFSISQSLSASPQSTSTSILSTAVAAAAQQLAISGRLNLSAKSTATTQEQRPHSIISTVSNDHRDSTLTAISSYDTESIFTDATSATNTHNTSAPGVPLHFKAIAIAAKLISGGQLNSTDIYSNSKRGIARWTVGLLAHQPFSIFNEEPPSSSSRKTSSASVTMKAAVAASAAATNNTDSKYYAKTLNSETNTENTTSSSDTIDMLQSRSSAHSSHKNSSRRRTPPTALPLMSSGSTTLASTELSGLSPATTSFTSAHAITTAMNTVPSGSVSGNGGNSSSSSICNSIELPLSSPPHSPTVATVRASSSGTVVTLRGQASTSSAGQHVLHSSKSGAARGLLAQLAEQHDTIQDAIMERWSKFAHAPEPASPLSAPASLHVTTSSASIASPLNEELNKPSKEDKVDIKIEEPVEEYDYINCLNKSRAKHSYLDSQQSTADTNREHNTDHGNKTADIVDNDATIRVKGSMTSAYLHRCQQHLYNI
ncbi:hypothetical protein BDF19DRAFT_326870 [Syncephalis fuscata]|nr:hypothetical protein BDF19DRAFT_326870 [Syncephalis fuscata]